VGKLTCDFHTPKKNINVSVNFKYTTDDDSTITTVSPNGLINDNRKTTEHDDNDPRHVEPPDICKSFSFCFIFYYTNSIYKLIYATTMENKGTWRPMTTMEVDDDDDGYNTGYFLLLFTLFTFGYPPTSQKGLRIVYSRLASTDQY
jgi:hypothetical protein